MSKLVWKHPATPQTGVAQGTAGKPRSQEFGPDVAIALANLRKQHGLTTTSCTPEGNGQDALDTLRQELGVALPGVNRRGFLQLTGAAAVFALAGCYYHHPDELVPYFQQPEGSTIGNPRYFSSVVRDGGRAAAVVVKSYDGRPIKIEGNPDHPLSLGRSDLRTQAALLNLYDPDREQHGPSRHAKHASTATTWEALDLEAAKALSSGSIGLITPPLDGVATRQLVDEFTACFGSRIRRATYDAFAPDEVVQARAMSFGNDQAKPPVHHVDRAAVLVTLGSDYLGGGTTGLADHIAFGAQRRLRDPGAKATMGQIIAFEPTLTQTGSCADVRVRVPMERMSLVGCCIARFVCDALSRPLPAALAGIVGGDHLAKALATLGLKALDSGEEPLAFTARQLVQAHAKGDHSLIYVGGATHCGENSIPLHVIGNFLNSILGNEGVTVETSSVPDSALVPSRKATLDILKATAQGEIRTLIMVGVNPAFSLPGATELLGRSTSAAVIVLADRADETVAAVGGTVLFAPISHDLESWGDAEQSRGLLSLQQPIINPLWDNRPWQESLMGFAVAAGLAPASFKAAAVAAPAPVASAAPAPGKVAAAPAAGAAPAPAAVPAATVVISVVTRKPLWLPEAHGVQSWRGYVQKIWLSQVKSAAQVLSSDRSFWDAALARGVLQLPQPMKAATTHPFQSQALAAVTIAEPPTGMRLVISASRNLRDGASANNPWLLEVPDPVSLITWDNYLAVSITDARAMSLWPNDVVALSLGSRTVRLPVHVQEGQDPGTLELFLGWGRRQAGEVARFASTDRPGIDVVNGFDLAGPGNQRWGLSATIKATGDTYQLATTQAHSDMQGREIALQDNLAVHRLDPAGDKRRARERTLWANGVNSDVPGSNLSLWNQSQVYPGKHWGMAVDLNTCTACQACLVACQAENNIPVVGRDEVRKNREMHWIRIDRYYSASIESDEPALDVDVIFQPVMCQQCQNAPCEEVCPPMATMHNDEGINVQIYNRCIGTRYCSNNCPYKVRRFNFYEYSKYRIGPQGAGSPFERIVGNIIHEGSTSSQEELTKAPLQMMLNPTITLRSKGVMEKCNFCVQRLRDIREEEKVTNHPYKDGTIKTACAQACPTDSIVFGDLNDTTSRVTRFRAQSPHKYLMLDSELNTRPSVAYLRRIRNRPATEDELKELGVGAEPSGPGATRPAQEHS